MVERGFYLEPNEQLRIAAKVNRLCEMSPEHFSHEHLADAKEIVKALDPQMDFRSSLVVEASHTHRSETKVHQGQTNLANVNASFGEDVTRQVSLGNEREYRVGSYVAVKWKRRRNRCWLLFEHFFGRGEVNASLNIHEPLTGILYNYKTLKLLEVTRFNAKLKRLGPITYVGRQKVEMWKRGQD